MLESVSMQMMSTRETAERLGIPTRTLHSWVTAGKIVPVFRGPGKTGALFFKPSDVEALAAELTAEAEARVAALRGESS